MALVLAIMHLYNIFKFYIVYANSFFFFFLSPGINKLDGMVKIPACPSLMCSFNRGYIEGTNSSEICV